MLESLSNQDIIILCCLVCSAFIIGIICIFLTLKKDKIKVEASDDDMNISKSEPDINVALATKDIPEISEEEPTLEEILNVDDFDNDFETEITDFASDKETEQDALNRMSIEEVLRVMNEDLEKQKYAKIDKYEEEQEENAVISYQELVARKMALGKEQDEVDVLPESYEESVEEFDEIADAIEPAKPKVVVTKKIHETSKFSNSEFISPIFGRLEENLDYPTLKKVEETETLTETTVKEETPEQSDEFLSTLKEFRRNL